jgi:hypothetical protein
MPPSHRRGPKPDRRRALELLASSRNGCTEAIMLAHGFTMPLLVELVRTGLATAMTERVVAPGYAVERTLVKHTRRRAVAEGERCRR